MKLRANVGPAIIILFDNDQQKQQLMSFCDNQKHLTVEYGCSTSDNKLNSVITITPSWWNVEIMEEMGERWSRFCKEICAIINGELHDN